MDSSPRSLRRFSRWKTTKRTFVLGGIAYKPENTNTILQVDSEKSEIVKKTTKEVNTDKNGKTQQFLNHSTTDSEAKPEQLSSSKITKPARQSSPEITKPTVVRRLCLDISKRTKGPNKDTVTTKEIQPVPNICCDVPIVNDNDAFRDDRLPHNTATVSIDKSKNSVEAGPSLALEQHESEGSGNGDVTDETAHQSNKCALSDISQNTSADKAATTQTSSSQTKTQVSVNGAAHIVHEAGIVPDKIDTCKRVDDGESSDAASTDKENKEKDPNYIDVIPPVKKLKQDGPAQHVSTSCVASRANNKSVGDLNVLQSDNSLNQSKESAVLTPRRSTLRNRDLLISPTALLKSRQYPVFHASGIKSVPDKSTSNGKGKSSVKTKSAFKKVTDKRQSPQLEIKSKHQNTIKSFSKKILVPENESLIKGHKNGSQIKSHKNGSQIKSHKNGSQIKDKDVEISHHEFTKNKGSLHKSITKNMSILEKSTITRKASGFSTTPATDKQINITHSHENNSSSKRGSLRDRSLLPTPEEMQEKRQYPISFFFSGRRSSIGSSEHSENKHITAKKKQKVSDQNKELVSPLNQTEPSSSKTLFRDLHLKNNKYENLVNSKRSTSSQKNSLAASDFLSSSYASSKELSHERKTRKVCQKTIAKTVNCENINMKVQTVSHANFPDRKDSKQSSHRQHLKKTLDLESEDSTSAKLTLTDLSSDRTCVILNDDSRVHTQKTLQARNTENLAEENYVDNSIKDTRASILPRKLSASKARNRLYSLPRRRVKKSSNEECSFTITAEGSSASSTEAHISSNSLQLSTTIVDKSWKQPQKIAHKRPSTKPKSVELSKAQTVAQKQVNVTRPKISANETTLLSQKQPRKRKLLKELEKAEQTVNNKVEHQDVFQWCEDGLPRKSSDVTAFDVILQTVIEVEEKLLDETDDGSMEHRLVRKVMRKVKHSIKPMISKAVEVKSLQREIRQQNGRICKLMTDIKEQEKKIAQFNSEMNEKIDKDEDESLIRVGELMKGYTQLMQDYANKPK